MGTAEEADGTERFDDCPRKECETTNREERPGGGDVSSGIPANTLRFCVSSRPRPSRLDVFIGL